VRAAWSQTFQLPNYDHAARATLGRQRRPRRPELRDGCAGTVRSRNARDEFSDATRCIDRHRRFTFAEKGHSRTMQQMAPHHATLVRAVSSTRNHEGSQHAEKSSPGRAGFDNVPHETSGSAYPPAHCHTGHSTGIAPRSGSTSSEGGRRSRNQRGHRPFN
jgi:hypothetical protein